MELAQELAPGGELALGPDVALVQERVLVLVLELEQVWEQESHLAKVVERALELVPV